jgi:hypothetical protein
MMEFVFGMAKVFRLICKEQPIILNLLQIKDLLLLKPIMDFVFGIAKVFRLICQKQLVIVNLQPINDLLLLKPIMEGCLEKGRGVPMDLDGATRYYMGSVNPRR